MRVFLDSNVILAAVIDDAELAAVAAQLMDSPNHEFVTVRAVYHRSDPVRILTLGRK